MAPALGRRLGLLLLLLFGVLTIVEGVPAAGERSRHLPKWIDGLWKKIRSGYDSVSGYSEYVEKKVADTLSIGSKDVTKSIYEVLNVPRYRIRSPSYIPDYPPAGRPTGYSVYSFLGLDENVLHHLKTFQSPSQPAAMSMFEHRGLIFWLVTETFTDAVGSLLQDRTGRLYVYAVKGNQLMSTVVETYGAVKCEQILKTNYFVDFVCAERLHQNFEAKKNGSGVYRMTWHGKLEVTFRRPLPTHSVRDLQVWRYEDHILIAFLNSLEVKSVYGSLVVEGMTEVTSDIFRHRSAVVDGKLFTSYNHLENAAFTTRHARSLAKLVIGSRHFLAVANYMGKDGNTETHSDIFVYEPGVGTKLFQRIRTSAARSWAAFTFKNDKKGEHFLVVANEYSVNAAGLKNYQTDSMIYKFYRNKFVPFQCIQTVAARQWVVYQGPKGEFLLALVSGQNGVLFYQYNGWRFIQLSYQIKKAGLKTAWMGFLPALNCGVLTLTRRDSHRPLVYYLTFQQFQPVVQEEEELRWCQTYRLGRDPREVFARVRAAPRRDQPYTFPGSLKILGNLLLAPARVSSTIGMIIVRDESYKVDHSFGLVSSNINEVRAAFARLARSHGVLTHSLKLDGPNLDGFRFSNLRFQCSTGGSSGSACFIDNLVATQINGQSVSLDGLLWLNRDLQLHNLHLDHVDIGAGVSATVTYLTGPDFARVHTAELVTLSGNHSISGHKDFGVVKVNSVFVSGTIDNIRVDEHNLLRTNKEQTITADYTMQSLAAKNVRLQTLNGRDFTAFIQQLVLNNTDTTITGHLAVRGDLLASSIQTARPATPLDPRDVAKRALLHNTKHTQVITGVHTLGGMSVKGDLRVVGTLNGLSVPRDVYLRSSNETVSRPVTFHTIQANSVQVLGRLGDVRVLNGQLDVLLLHGDQQVSGKKVFLDMVLLGHSSVSLTVSGYRLQDLENTAMEDLIQGLESGRTIYGDVIFEGKVHIVDAVLGGANITHILLNALPLQTTSISSKFIFEGLVKIVGDTSVTTYLNGKRVGLYALLAGTHVFSRSVSFTSDVFVEGDVHVATTVNGINLRELSRILALKDSTKITVVQDVTLHSPSFLGGLRVHSGGIIVVAGVDLQDVVLRDTDAVITGTKTFHSVQVESMTAGHVVVAQGGQVDGVVLEDLFFGNSLRKTGKHAQHLVGRSLNVVAATSVTGTQLGAFEKSVVYRDSASERLSGSLRFTGPVTIQDLTFGGKFDGVSADEYKSAWLMNTGDQVLTGQNIIQSMDALELTFTGRTLQGVDFERLVKNTAKIDEITVLHRVAFDQLMSNAEVVVNGTVQGFKLSEEAMTTTTAAYQTVTGKKIFQAKVHYRGQFSIEEHIIVSSGPDDKGPLAIDIEGLCAAIMSIPAASTRIRRWIIQGDARFQKNVLVLDTFNGEAVATLGTTFWLMHVPTTITAVAYFASIEAKGDYNVDVEGKTNGQSLEGVWNQLLKRKCEAQTVNGQLTVHTLSLDHLSTPTLTNPNDDLHIADMHNILLQDGDQVISGLMNFTSVEAQEVALEGTLNGLRVYTDFVLYGRQATISAKKTFAHLTILGNLSMVDGGTVQGVDVSELNRLAARKAGEGQVIIVPGTTTLRSLVYTGSLFQVDGTVDGVLLRPDTVLMRTGKQVITGTLEVTPVKPGLPVVEAGLLVVLNNKFNGVDLDKLENRTVRIDRQVTIQHSVTFEGICRFNSIILESHSINGRNIKELADLINADYLIRLGDHLGAALHAARSTREVLAVKGAEIWYYEELPFETVSKLIGVTLIGAQLEAGMYDSLVGIDLTSDAVYIYSIDVPFSKIHPAVRVLEPIAVTGLGSGLLATCGRQPMDATPSGTYSLPKFTIIHLEDGTGTGYGHIYSLSDGGLLAAFETKECRDLVSFQLPDGRVCVAVLNYRAATTVLCGTVSTGFHLLSRLDTTRAVKGVWVSFYESELLYVAQEQSQTETGILEVYKYNSALNKMILLNKAYEPVSSHVTAMVLGDSVLVAVTGKLTPLCDTFVEVFLSNTTDIGHNVQRLEVPEAVHSSLIHLHTGDVLLMVQTRHSLYHYYMRGTKFVFNREMKTASSLCPWSTPFLAGDPKTLLIAHAGLGDYLEDYKGAKLQPVSTTVYRAVYRGPSFTTLYRGTSHVSSSLHSHHPSPPPSSQYYQSR